MLPALLFGLSAVASPSSGELQRRLDHLDVAGSVLYVAAHPDDENTRLIAWLVGDQGLRTGYLSMTRGGGGQNLIGTEQSEMLAVVRTGELLQARRIDGGEQLFTRARDFGYSKSSEEALSVWGHDEALADVVLAIRTFRPDVVITRFGASGTSHGHHTASAQLASEAFEAAADPARFPDLGEPWQVDRLIRNQSSWRIDDDTDTSAWTQVDVGTYDPRTGLSFGEVAAASRTMHKSQGFGSAPQIGPVIEYFSPVAGTPIRPDGSLFEGLDLTLDRLEGSKSLQKALAKAKKAFDPAAPHTALPALAQAHAAVDELEDEHWKALKKREIEQLMIDCAGLVLTARAQQRAVTPSGKLSIDLTGLVRNPAEVETVGMMVQSTGTAWLDVRPGIPFEYEMEVNLPAAVGPTVPHWLHEAPSHAAWAIGDPAWRNAADTPASLQLKSEVALYGVTIEWWQPVEYAWTDRVHGERVHPVEVLPPATASFEQRGLLVPVGVPASTQLSIRADAGPAEGTVRLQAPAGVTVTPDEIPFRLSDGEKRVALSLTATEDASPGPLEVVITVGDQGWAYQQRIVDHVHLPRRTVLFPATLEVTPVALDRGDTTRVGYVMGSGDTMPDVLRSLGYQVELLDLDALGGDLSRFDAIVLGIRAYNTQPQLMMLNDRLLAYVEGGGRVIAQYNTNSRWSVLKGPIGPAPFTIGRDRVTDETARITPLDPKHPVLTGPNVLTDADWDGWVQERGLYFATEWDPAWTPVFAMNDAGEAPLKGSTLVARHGDGVFVYTGISFFRQLPAGVPGATRLFANLLAL